VQAADAFPCLIVVPNLVKLNWLRELDLWLPGRSITLLDSKGDVKAGSFRKHAAAGGGRRTITLNDTTADFMVVNYDILKKVLPRFAGTKLGAVIYDEAHYLKNPKAQRTIAATNIARLADLRLMATGTAILNRPIELLSPLTILGRIGELGGKSQYQRRYCDGHMDSLGHWDVSGASNLDELNERLRETCYVRRDKRDVLTELPPVQRQSVLLPITNRAEYRRAEKDVVEWARTQATEDRRFRATLTGMSKADKAAAIKRHADEVGKRAESAEALRRMSALRRLTGEGKVEAVKEWAAEFRRRR
jgi:SWI/SNF-related matrix-associated actin-dependent regulator 1 of chromatin subfamily A